MQAILSGDNRSLLRKSKELGTDKISEKIGEYLASTKRYREAVAGVSNHKKSLALACIQRIVEKSGL